MPENMISRIESIQSRIKEIENIGKSFKSKKTAPTEPKKTPDGSTFSEILKEVIQSRAINQADILGTGPNATNSLLDNRLDTLMETYKKNGMMPTTVAKPILGREIQSTNPGTWDHIIEDASKKFDLDPKLIHAVIRTESGYNPKAVSHAGAQGLMQLMPETAQEIGVKNPFDAQQNILGGTQYLRMMLDRYNNDLVKALAAYNAGPHRVDRANGVPNISETKDYVPKVLNFYYNTVN